MASRRQTVATLLLLGGLMLVTWGYWGPWVWAEPAGLRVLGLDLAEYVKFVAEVRDGQIQLQREVFYLPLIALSLSLSLLAHRPEFRLPRWLRWVLNLLALPVALAMLPPAWTPPLLTTPEFRLQTALMGVCLLSAFLAYPLLRRLPWPFAAALVTLLAVAAVAFPLFALLRLRPALDSIFGQPIDLGRGPWQTTAGFALITLATLLSRGQLTRIPQQPAR